MTLETAEHAVCVWFKPRYRIGGYKGKEETLTANG